MIAVTVCRCTVSQANLELQTTSIFRPDLWGCQPRHSLGVLPSILFFGRKKFIQVKPDRAKWYRLRDWRRTTAVMMWECNIKFEALSLKLSRSDKQHIQSQNNAELSSKVEGDVTVSPLKRSPQSRGFNEECVKDARKPGWSKESERKQWLPPKRNKKLLSLIIIEICSWLWDFLLT